ncbi:MAG: hypothetical protein KR126chlam5_01226, partial [Candidatus Anoxychlamydiales bacterium]|nr:hypothetical protein [Candidatus Anoxychlamydiales bacterium]
MNIVKKISWITLATLITSNVFANSQDISNYSDPCPSQKVDKCDDDCYEIS